MVQKLTMELALKKIKNEKGRKAIKKYKVFLSAEDVYLFKSGETLVFYNTDSIYLYNRDESRELDEQMNSEFLSDPDDSFVSKIPEYIANLISYINLSDYELGYTIESIDMIDKKISELLSKSDFDEIKLYKPLLAYIGSVIINNYPASKWEFIHFYDSKKNNKKDLCIRMSNNKLIPLSQTLKSLFINNDIKRYVIISKVESAILLAK